MHLVDCMGRLNIARLGASITPVGTKGTLPIRTDSMLNTVTTLLLLPILGFGCEDEPVLQAIETPTLLDEIPSAEERLATKDLVEYRKKEGIYIDVRYLGGRNWTSVQPTLAEQLGDLQDSQELPMRQGLRYQYEKGSIYIYEDQIYRIDLPLPEELRRSATLQLLGFPEQVDKYLITHREYVLENEWEFRRIRMKRVSKDNELVNEVSAWKFSPQEL